MGDLGNKVEQSVEREEVMKLLFGEQFEDLVDDGLEGSKEEYQIFVEVFCRTNMEDAKIDDTCTKLSATKVSIDQTCGNAKTTVKETSAFESFQESSSSCGGSSSCSVLVTQEKISPTKHLCQEKDPENISYPDTSTDLACLHPSELVLDAPLERPPCEQVPSTVHLDRDSGGLSLGENASDREKKRPERSCPAATSDVLLSGTSTLPIKVSNKKPLLCREVDSLQQGIVSTHNIFNCDGDTDTTKFTDDSVVLNYNGRLQHMEDVKVAVKGISVTSPVSQESVASGLLASSVHFAPGETSSAIISVEKSTKTPLNLYTVDAVVDLKRNPKRKLPCRLELYAHRLLVDAGWKIEPRQRNDRTIPAYFFKNTKEGLVTKALSVAWKACGKRLLASESELELDENGRAWWDADSFWRDMTDTMAFIDNEATQQESSVSLLHRWQLLDPFMAVVWIDKKVGALRAGKGLRAAKSTTFILGGGRRMILADMGMGSPDKNAGEVNLCLANSLNQSVVPYCQNSEATDLQNSHNLTRCTGLYKKGTKSLARRVGKGLCNVKCLPMVSAGLVSRRKRSKRLSRKATFIQRDPHFLFSCNNGNKNLHCLEETPSLGGDDNSGQIDTLSELQSPADQASQFEGNIFSSTGIDLTCNSVYQKFSLKPKRTAGALADDSSKIVRKKSKKIPEVEATKAIGTGMKRKLSGDNCREEFAPSMGVEHHKPIMRECRTKGSNSNESSSMISKKQKIRPESNMASKLLVDPKVADFLDSRNVPKESDDKGTSNGVLITTSVVSTDHGSNQKLIKANKSKVNKKNRQKKFPRCRINDDDLLISAIIKNKDFSSSRKMFSPKAEASQLKALRKLTSQKGKCKLFPRALKKAGNHYVDGGRITLGTRTVLCWLIEMGAVSLKDSVQCRNPKNNTVVKDGWVTREGILCKCCTQVFSVSGFKTHAGLKQQKPSLNLLMLCGKPYTLCQLQAWSTEFKKRKSHLRVMGAGVEDENDDTCGICGDGGDLICCDNCPSTYHQACVPTQELPEGSWYCTNCICATCGDLVNGKETAGSLAVLECSQCGHKYHSACIAGNTACSWEIGSSVWFCGASCQEVYMGMRSRVGVANYIDDGFSWTVLRCSHNDKKVCSEKKIALVAECNTKLAIALTLMEECFLRMVDPRTGIDMIPHVLYNLGSPFARLNYQGFYAVVLESGDQLISVASIRVHGATVAEMPLIATSSEYRRQGMCRRLLNAIEKMLISLKVKMLVLSAVPSVVETWTSGFGFKPVGDGEKRQLTNINLMTFPGTILLKKNLYEASAQESVENFDLCSREQPSYIRGDLMESANTVIRHQSTENLISDMDAKSLPSIIVNTQAELSFQQRERETLIPSQNINAMNGERTIPIQGDKVAVDSLRDNNDAILSDDQAEKGPCSSISHEEFPNTLRSVEDNTSQNMSIIIKRSSVNMLNNERKISILGDEVERKSILDASKGNVGGCISDELGTHNLIEINLEGIDNGEVTRDEKCGFIAKHTVSKGCTVWSVEA